MIQFLRAHVGLAVSLAILVFGGLVVGFTAYQMKARGLSLKPIWWFTGFILLVVGPQVVYHTMVAVSVPRTASSVPRVENPESLFGETPEGASVVDVQPQMTAGLLSTAQRGRFITLPNGDTMIVAQFTSSTDTTKAASQYLREAGLERNARSDGGDGFIVPGMNQASGHIYPSGNVLVVHMSPAGLPAQETPDPINKLTSTSGKVALAVGLLVYVLIVSIYFLKGLTWATRIDAKPVSIALSGSDLRQRLLALNSLDVPFRVESTDTRELQAIWRYADAKWVDLARAHGFRRMHRITMSFDESNRKIRATDYQSAYDWSAGGSGASFAWRASTGIVLFQYEHQRVYGLQFDSNWSPKPQLSYSYTFDLQEMKSPLIEAITSAGCHWQPVAWQAPANLRWLVE